MDARLATVTALGLALIATPAGALKVKKRDESWGKPGVTLAQYSADALECSNATYTAPISLSPLPPMPTGFVGVALPSGYWLDLRPAHVVIYTTTLVEGVKHARWMEISEQLQTVLDSCLTNKGYTRFRLTRGQMDRLDHLKRASPERQQYLYHLGTDAAVVVPQRI